MSGDSPPDLSDDHVDTIRDGSRVTHPSIDLERDGGDMDAVPLVSKPEKTYRTRDSNATPRSANTNNFSRPRFLHDPEESSLVQRRRSRRRSLSELDSSKFTNRMRRGSMQNRHRYDDYDRFDEYDEYDDDYDRPYRPRHHQPREYRRSRDPYYDDDDRIRYMGARKHRSRYADDPDDRYVDRDSTDEVPRPRARRILRPAEDEDSGHDREGEAGKDASPNRPDIRKSRIQDLTKEEKKEMLRLPWTAWMNSDFKNHFVASLGEFVGTTMFLFFAFAGTQVANIPSGDAASNSTSGGATGFNPTVLLYISLVFSFSLMVNVWVFFRISGGLFNPAVTFAMFLVKAIPLPRAVCLFAAQIAGSIAASALVLATFPTPLNVRTTLSGGATIAQGLFIEALLTFELVFTIFMLAKEKHRATFIAPVGIGLALFIAELCGVFYTGGSLNPARSLGPCIVTNTYDREHWIYWVGPLMGSLFAVVFYWFIKALEYEVANPGQDDGGEAEVVKVKEKGEREKVEGSPV